MIAPSFIEEAALTHPGVVEAEGRGLGHPSPPLGPLR